MAFKDVREFIEMLDKTGEVVHIQEEVDWDIELGAIERRAAETGAPACLFERIKDYPGYRVLGNSLASWRRLAIAFGLAPETPPREMQAEYERRIEQPIKPVLVSDGPCKENVLVGDEVDLFRFPAPLEHEGDGNRCIGSWHAVVTKDPDSDWTNWGMYRLMIHNRRYIGGHWSAVTDLAKILHSKFAPQGKPMPVAVAIGVDPMCCLAAIAPLGVGVSEVDYAGGLRGEPVELVKCETSDLLVPANTDIVIEGEILPDIRVPSGPFGDFTAHQFMGPYHEVCRVKAITHRHNPILTVSHLGLPRDESSICSPFVCAVVLKKVLQERGVPVTNVYLPPECSLVLAIVGVRNLYSTVADHVFNVLDSATERQHIVVVVDEDVDVFNWQEVLHALVTKMHPARDIRVNSHRLVVTLLNFLSPEDRKLTTDAVTKGASVLFDCTTPLDWSRETDVLPRTAFRDTSPDIRDKVLAKWKSYGFK